MKQKNMKRLSVAVLAMLFCGAIPHGVEAESSTSIKANSSREWIFHYDANQVTAIQRSGNELVFTINTAAVSSSSAALVTGAQVYTYVTQAIKDAGTGGGGVSIASITDATSGGDKTKKQISTLTFSDDSTKTFAVAGEGAVDSGDVRLLSGGTAYTELRPVTSTNYVAATNTTAANLSALDTAIGKASAGNWIVASAADSTHNVATNLTNLDNAIGKVASAGNYIAASGMTATDNVAANLSKLDTKIGAATTKDTSIYAASDDVEMQISKVAGKLINTVTNAVSSGSDDAQTVTLTDYNNDTKTFDIEGLGEVVSGDKRLLSGGTAYTELRPVTSMNYVAATATTAANLSALDKKIGAEQTGNYYTAGTESVETKLKNLDTAIGAKTSVTDLYETTDSVEAQMEKVGKKTIKEVSDAVSNGSTDTQKITLTKYDNTTETIEIAGEGAVASDDVRLLSGKTAYEELRPTGSSYNYISNQATKTNLEKLDTAIGKVGSGSNYLIASAGTAETNVATNLTKLDTAIGKTAAGHYISAQDGETVTVATNLKELDDELYEHSKLVQSNATTTAAATKIFIGNDSSFGGVTEVSIGTSDGGTRILSGVSSGTATGQAASWDQVAASGKTINLQAEYSWSAGGKGINHNQIASNDGTVLATFQTMEKISDTDYGFVSGKDLYKELKVTKSGSYVMASNTTAENLLALDRAVSGGGIVRVGTENKDTIYVGLNPEDDTTYSGVTKINIGNGGTRTLSGVASATAANEAVEFSQINTVAPSNTNGSYIQSTLSATGINPNGTVGANLAALDAKAVASSSGTNVIDLSDDSKKLVSNDDTTLATFTRVNTSTSSGLTSNDFGFVAGADLYAETRAAIPAANNYIAQSSTVGANLSALDQAIGKTAKGTYISAQDGTSVTVATNLAELDEALADQAKLVRVSEDDTTKILVGSDATHAAVTTIDVSNSGTTRTIAGVSRATTNNQAATWDQIAQEGQTISLSTTTHDVNGKDIKANQIATNDGKLVATFAMMGNVAANDTGFVSGGNLYQEVRQNVSGTYVAATNDVGTNLSKLDAAITDATAKAKIVRVGTDDDADTIFVGKDGTDETTFANVTTIDIGNGTTRTITGVAAGTANTDAANVGQLVSDNGGAAYTMDTDGVITVSNKAGGTAFTLKISGNGSIAADDTKVISGGTAYAYLNPTTGNYVTSGATTAANLEALDSAIGKVTGGTYIAAASSVATNLSALDTKIGTINDGNTSKVKQANTVSQNLEILDKAITDTTYTGSDSIEIVDKAIKVKNMVQGASGNSISLGAGAAASGYDSFAIGYNATASGENSGAYGYLTKSYSNYSYAAGYNAVVGTEGQPTSGGQYGIAIGTGGTGASATVLADYGIAIGTGAKVDSGATKSTAIGYGATASRLNSGAYGHEAKASGAYSGAYGYKAEASATNSGAYGYTAIASGRDSGAYGFNATAAGSSSGAYGNNSKAYANYSYAAGANAVVGTENNATSGGFGGISIGNGTADYSSTESGYTKSAAVLANYGIAIGTSAIVKANASYSTAIGYGATTGDGATVNSGQFATAVGAGASATGQWAGAYGYGANASGNSSGAYGYNSKVYSNYSYAAGSNAVVGTEGNAASGVGGIAIGNGFVAYDASSGVKSAAVLADYGIAIGTSAKVNSTASSSTAVGYGATVSGMDSGAYGKNSKAYTHFSYAAGSNAVVGTESDSTTGGTYGIAIGNGTAAYNADSGIKSAAVLANFGVAIGTAAKVDTEAMKAFVAGYGASAQAASAVALGDSATVTHASSVAIGANSATSEANSVSVGASTSSTRTITNVTKGDSTKDAANWDQIAKEGQTVSFETNKNQIVSNDNTVLATFTKMASVASDDYGFVSGVDLYNETRANLGSSQNYISAQDAGANLLALDAAIGKVTTKGTYISAQGAQADGTFVSVATNLAELDAAIASQSKIVHVGTDGNTNQILVGSGTEFADVDTINVGNTGTTNATRKIVGVTAGGQTGEAAVWDQIAKKYDADSKTNDIVINKTSQSGNIVANNNDILAKITVVGDGTIAADDKGLLTGATAYAELRDGITGGNYIDADYKTSKNLSNLDAAIGKVTGTHNYITAQGQQADGSIVSVATNLEELDAAIASQSKIVRVGGESNEKILIGRDDTSETTFANVTTIDISNNGNRTLMGVASGKEDGEAVEFSQINTVASTTQTNGTYLTSTLDDSGNLNVTGTVGANLAALDAKAVSTKEGTNVISLSDDSKKLVSNDGTALATFTRMTSVASDDYGFVSGADLYNELRVVGKAGVDYNYIDEDNTTAQNLKALDAAIKAGSGDISKLIKLDGTQILIGNDTEYDGVTSIDIGNGDTRKLTGVTAGEANTDAANVGQIAKSGQTVNLSSDARDASKTELGKKNEIVSNDGTVLATFEKMQSVSSTDTGFVSGADLYNETRSEITSTNYISKTASAGANLSTLDAKLAEVAKANTDAVDDIYADLKASDGSYVKEANTAGANLNALDTAIGAVAEDGNVIKASLKDDDNGTLQTTVSQNLVYLDTKIGKIDDQQADGTAFGTIDKTATISANLMKLDKAISDGVTGDLTKVQQATKYADAKATGTNAVALGNQSDSSGATGTNAMALGTNAAATSENAIALGTKSDASGANSVALGSGSVAKEANTVSVGSEGNERRITNVADGVNDTDAANVGQLKSMVQQNFDGIRNELTTDINRVGAGAAALSALRPEGFDPTDKISFAVGYGHYRGANAGALGVFFKPNADTTLSFGGTLGNGDSMVNAGVSFKLGSGSKNAGKYTTGAAVSQELSSLRKDNDQLSLDNRSLKRDNATQAKRIETLEANNAKQVEEISNLKADNEKIKADNARMQKQIERILSEMAMWEAAVESDETE